MKRIVVGGALLLAVASAFLLVAGWPAGASSSATITVDSTADTNARDGVLTLREAMLLAKGDLAVGDLDAGEADNVSGAPGPAADTILFDTGIFPTASPATISLSSSLPLLSTGNDTVDASGTGVILDGVTKSVGCFGLSSAGNTVRGFEMITNCTPGVSIDGDNNTLGGSSSSHRNVISGNGIEGNWAVAIGGSGNVVKGNYIGTDATGTVAVPNNGGGVLVIFGLNNTIGGSTAAERNIISGNTGDGVQISEGASGNVVKGNYIGTDASGNGALPNNVGVKISVIAVGGGTNNTIGGSGAAERNVISGNHGTGVSIYGAGSNGNVVKGNFIGTDASGGTALGNGGGVVVGGGAHNNSIGGTATGEGNLIAFNTWPGVRVGGGGTTGNTIRGNSIHSNEGEGIETHDGGNNELTPPTITSVGPVVGSACANCTVDIYSDDEDEGRTYEGSATAGADGNFTWSGTPSGPNVTATATDVSGNTSEFSEPFYCGGSCQGTPTPTVTPTPTPTGTATATSTPPATPTPAASTWKHTCYVGAEQPIQQALADITADVQAVYRLNSSQTFDRWFPGRPELSTITTVSPYQPLLILMSASATWSQQPSGTPPSTVSLAQGWNSVCYAGQTKSPGDATAGIAGAFSILYRLGSDQTWSRYVPGRPEVSNITQLVQYDAVLLLVNAEGGTQWIFSP